jgi:hypothetical protein
VATGPDVPTGADAPTESVLVFLAILAFLVFLAIHPIQAFSCFTDVLPSLPGAALP